MPLRLRTTQHFWSSCRLRVRFECRNFVYEVISGISLPEPPYPGLWLLNSSIKELFYISGSRGFVHVSCVLRKKLGESGREKLKQGKGLKSLAIVWKKLKNENLHPSLWCLSSYADIKCFSTQELFRLALLCVDNISLLCVKQQERRGKKIIALSPSPNRLKQWQCKFLFNSSMSKASKINDTIPLIVEMWFH